MPTRLFSRASRVGRSPLPRPAGVVRGRVPSPSRPPRSRDPTGTGPIRRAFRNDIEMRLQRLKALVKLAIVDQDILGIGKVTMTSLTNLAHLTLVSNPPPRMSFDPDHRKLQMFNAWFLEAAYSLVVDRGGFWIDEYIHKAFQHGVNIAKVEISRPDIQPLDDRERAIVALAQIELKGATDAMVHNAGRAMASALLAGETPNRILATISKQIDAIGKVRLRALCSTYIVRGFNEAKLDVYQAAGFRQVGIIAETHAPQKGHTHDAERKKPSAREQQRIERREQKLSELGLVEVLTAGDDLVCDECEDISNAGPYDIDQARGLIPAHPNCRCAFIPEADQRFAEEPLV